MKCSLEQVASPGNDDAILLFTLLMFNAPRDLLGSIVPQNDEDYRLFGPVLLFVRDINKRAQYDSAF